MPKVRERSRITQDFAVTPWQSKREIIQEPTIGVPYIIEEALLLAPEARSWPSTVPRDSLKPAPPPQEQNVDTQGWFTKAPRHAPVSELEFSVTTAQTPIVIGTHDDEAPRHLKSDSVSRVRSGLEVTGLCQLAVTPAGHGMGHIFITRTGNHSLDSRRARCYGIAVRPVPPAVPPDPCTDDDCTDLLCARLTDFVSGATVDVLVARTGGDMCNLAPPADWLLRRWFGDDFESDSDTETSASKGIAAGRREWGEEGEEDVEPWSTDEAESADMSEVEDESAAEDDFEGEEGGASEAKAEADAAPVSDGGCRGEGPPCTADGTTGPQSAADWLTWWLRHRRRRPGLELHFEPETLFSGAAALPKLAEFAQPLLPPRLARATGGGGLQYGGGAATADADAGSAALGRKAAVGADGAPARVEAGEGSGVGVDVDIDAVVCLGPITLQGLPRAFLRGAG
ncbi:hypothetical protein VOLCADRAFT_94350 [Volvox carteri f. nagariensis]|uniref:Uncharacterized protein n=1 Tax=Volvox carteri f. nagariensis TaxID=3068 RepID=D8U4J7_VOLCA|nr:uncharacterized protein VOLCADRAFT_94350 [Volvox carteri f. nagariensis]EFJ45203.1 hypothetical protein VOLCADRAFT_94350 [Volvox carteri f. nagariensis]|eukprot:XP_002953579.1 hypothetical protein VOLCADRAFT_94350 [Volvox carteri f. nagariensis]